MNIKSVVMDVDTAMGIRGGDIDDAHAIALMAGQNAGYTIDAINVTAGNVSLRSGLRCTSLVCDVLGINVEMGAGVETPMCGHLRTGHSQFLCDENAPETWVLTEHDGTSPTPQSEDSVELLRRKLVQAPRELLAVAPMTNVARFVQKYPELKSSITRIVTMGGWYAADAPCGEFNIATDAPAAPIVYSSGIPMVVVPIDMTTRARLTEGEIWHWAKIGRAGRIFYDGTMDWLIHLKKLHNEESCCLHDPLGAACLVWDDFYDTRGIVPAIDPLTGVTRVDEYDESSPVRLVMDFDIDVFKRRYHEAMTRVLERAAAIEREAAAK